MLTMAIGTSSAACFGAADFLGGLAARRTSAMVVTGLAAVAGVVALAVVIPFTGGVWHGATWIGGAATGLASCAGIWLLYSAYAVGPMTTLAPVAAVVSTVVPMIGGLVTGESFGWTGTAAMAVGLVAIALVAASPDPRAERARPVDVVKATVAGALLGVFYIYLDSSSGDAGLTPILANRITCAAAAFVIVAAMAARRRPLLVEPPEPDSARRRLIGMTVTLALVSGTLDAAANALFDAGLEVGDLSVLSVITGFYPVVTIALALVLLHERPSSWQRVGIVLAIGSLAGMSVG